MTQKFQLKNGLKVIFNESHKSPVVSVQMWVRTGSVDERRGEEGISHFIEHLVFKGTQKFKVGEIAAVVEGSGGELNAYTSFDQTVFYVTLSNEYFDTGLDVISQMMGAPTFDAQEIDNEREVVIEEIKRGQDSLGRQASQLLFKTAFQRSAYRVPVIGFEKNIRKLSPRKIRAFFSARYTPENMFLVVTGAFDSKAARKKIEIAFGDIPRNKLEKRRRQKEPTQRAPRVSTQATQFEQSIGYLAWKIPGAAHQDIPALDVLSLIVGQGDSSRLTKRLRLDQPLVNSIGMGNYLPLEGGLTLLSFGFEKSRATEIFKALNSEIDKIKSEGPSEDEVKKAVINLESGEIYSMETVDGLARRLGAVEFQFRDLKAFDRYFKALRTLTPKEIQRVANKYLVYKTASIALTTKGETGPLKKAAKTFLRDLQVKSKRKPASAKTLKLKKLTFSKGQKTSPKVELISLTCGARVLFRPSSETALVSAKVAFLGGLREEPGDKNGLVELFGRTWLGGTKRHNEHELMSEMDRIAASVNPVVGKNSIGLSLECLSQFEKEGAGIFFDVLMQPTLPESVMERERELQIHQIRHKKDNPTQIVFSQFLKAMFSNHPYSKELLGTVEGLQAVSRPDLAEYREKLFHPAACHFAICGQIDREYWIDKIDSAFDQKNRNRPRLPEHPLSELERGQTLFEAAEKEQAHLVLGYRSFAMNDPRKTALQILQSILAGQGGRLFVELRDKESLAYSVAPTRLEGLEGGYFGAYIGCSPEKAMKAVTMMRAEFQRLCVEKVGPAELDRAKRYLIGRHDIDLQRTSAMASSLLYEDLYGIDFNEVFRFPEMVKAISAEELMSVAQEVFSAKEVISVVGPMRMKENLLKQ